MGYGTVPKGFSSLVLCVQTLENVKFWLVSGEQRYDSPRLTGCLTPPSIVTVENMESSVRA